MMGKLEDDDIRDLLEDVVHSLSVWQSLDVSNRIQMAGRKFVETKDFAPLAEIAKLLDANPTLLSDVTDMLQEVYKTLVETLSHFSVDEPNIVYRIVAEASNVYPQLLRLCCEIRGVDAVASALGSVGLAL